jgi:hypothetical protein
LVFAQSEPPSRLIDGDSPPTYFVGGHEQPVARLAPLRRCVLDDQVLTLATVDRAAHHLDVLADAVLLVHDVVAGLELDGVDRVAPPRRQPARVLGQRSTLAGEVGLGEERKLERRRDETAVESSGRDVDDARLSGGGCDQARGHLGRTEALDGTLGRPVPVEYERNSPAIPSPAPQILDRGVGIAPVGGRRLERAGQRRRTGQLGVRAQLGDPPPWHPQLAGLGVHFLEVVQRGGAEIDGRLAATSRCGPGRLEELVGRAHQIGRASADPLGVTEHDVGTGG